MRCLCRRICSKIKRLLILYIIVSILIFLLIFLHNKPLFWLFTSNNISKSIQSSPTYPGSFLKNYKPNNESYCNFMYNLPEELLYEEGDFEFSPELGVRSPYRVLYNVVRAKQNWSGAASVTYATHLTPDFVSYIAEVVRYWEGPISIAAFVPHFDADILTRQLIKLCHCLPQMSKVSVHYVFPKQHPILAKQPPPLPIRSCSVDEFESRQTFRNRKALLYPVNVCRNVARNASTTNFVMVSDIELIPSKNLATRFTKTVANFFNSKFLNFPSRVFVVPTFEVDKYEQVPRDKGQLLRLISQERAVYFHRHICLHCQKFPGIEQWLNQNPGNVIKLFSSTTRIYPYHRWEPIYIGTRNEPYYSEVLSWEGKQDKMTQMLEMCLMGYRFLILDGAFLVHWPGIKRKSFKLKNNNIWRSPYQFKNSRQYSKIVQKLSDKYKENRKCKVQ